MYCEMFMGNMNNPQPVTESSQPVFPVSVPGHPDSQGEHGGIKLRIVRALTVKRGFLKSNLMSCLKNKRNNFCDNIR